MAYKGEMIPKSNPRYQIIDEIGQGGMSTVYLAKDMQLDITVAVKEVRSDLKYDKNGNKIELYIKGLEDECNFLKKADHPALPRTVGIYHEQKIYVIMDYIAGKDMSKALKEANQSNQKLPQELVLECALQICDALRYLQAQNPPIIYRDLKPSNIMLKSDGSGFKLIDFGTAVEYRPGQTYKGMGTKGFGAPEQLNVPSIADLRSDVYSLGATMYNLLTGVKPSEKQMHDHPVRELNPAVSVGLANVIKRCVEPDPSRRYQNAAELLYALEHYNEEDESFKRKQRGKLNAFIATAVLAGVMLIAGTGMLVARSAVEKSNYEALVGQGSIKSCTQAIELQESNPEAYIKLLEIYAGGNSESKFDKAAADNMISHLSSTSGLKMEYDEDYLELYWKLGNVYFTAYSGDDDTTVSKLKMACEKGYQKIVDAVDNGDVKGYDQDDMYKIAKNYCEINELCQAVYNNNGGTNGVTEVSKDDLNKMLDKMEKCIKLADGITNGNANYVKAINADLICSLLNQDAKEYCDAGISEDKLLDLLSKAYGAVKNLSTTNTTTQEIINELGVNYASYYANISKVYGDKQSRDEINQQKGAQGVTT